MDSVRLEIADGVATVTLDRPPVNAVDGQANAELREVFEALGDNRQVRAAILTGAGERAFCAGIDLEWISAGAPSDEVMDTTDAGRRVRDAFWSVYECGVPVVAAVNGVAIGAGLAFAAVCDVLVAAEESAFGLTEIDVGLLGGSSFANRLVGPYKARKMFYTGEMVPAAELYRLGSVEQVVPRDKVRDAARDIAQEIASKSPLAIRLAKESANRMEDLPLKEGYRVEQDYTTRLLRFEDSEEARRAFFEKREPVWRWR